MSFKISENFSLVDGVQYVRIVKFSIVHSNWYIGFIKTST